MVLSGNKKNSPLHRVFNNSYPKSIKASSLAARIPLKVKDHPDSIKMYKTLLNLYQNVIIEPSEVSTLLEIGWENVDSPLRKKYPSSLLTLQLVLQRCGIMTFSQLPDNIPQILQLLKNIPQHNPAIRDLLSETLQLRIPTCFPALYIGQGYNCLLDTTTHRSPFQFSGSYKTSPLGLIPDEISCRSSGEREIVFKFFTGIYDYVNSRLQDLNIKQYLSLPSTDLGTNHLSSLLRNGYNLIKLNQDVGSCNATANVEYRQFQLTLSRDKSMDFQEDFWDTLKTIGELDTKDPDNVEAWRQFLITWGTHVVKTAYGGGSVQVTFRGKILSGIVKSLNKKCEPPIGGEIETNKIFQWITGDGLLNSARRISTANKDANDHLVLQGYDVTAKFHGGDTKFNQMDPTKLSRAAMAEAREEWIQSLQYNPIIHETNLVLVPLSQYVREKSEGLATKIDVAANYFYSNLAFSKGSMNSSCTIL